jgi:hypothetical protein
VIKPGMDSREIIARFEAERQALALMDHPNIAGVLDAGTTQNGRPYFAMELVKGTPITVYCNEHQLTIRQRLELFIPVCQAVQHAHQKAILHRDLKPSNILVTEVDGKPVPKVIDFGIAKALHATAEPALHATLAQTLAGMIVGTPQYMSPEQAGSMPDVDTRSDVYTLGVILYELLVGDTPVSREQLKRAAFDEVLRVIRESEPRRPSSRFIPVTDMAKTTASQRHTEPKKLGHALRGDLDWILLKALEKDRARRYDTANAFAQDLQRHLNDEPVSAGPPSAGYRLRKLVRRNRLAFAAAAAVLMLLAAGITASTWQAVRATKAEQLAEGRLYAANMNLAQAAWEETNISRLRGLLEETRTYPHRGFEWYYWQRQTHLELLTLRGHEDGLSSVAFSHDGRRIVTASGDKTAKTWDAETGSELLTLKGHALSGHAVAFSSDGRRIVTGSDDSMGDMGFGKALGAKPKSNDPTAKVWDAETGRELLTLNPIDLDNLLTVWSRDLPPPGGFLLRDQFQIALLDHAR